MHSNFYSRFVVNGLKIDYYFIAALYEITDACLSHALKKLLRVGRSHKSIHQDVQDAIDTLRRWQELNPLPQVLVNTCEPMGCVQSEEPWEDTTYSAHYYPVAPEWFDEDLDGIHGWAGPGWYLVESGPFANTMGNIPYLSRDLALAHANPEQFKCAPPVNKT